MSIPWTLAIVQACNFTTFTGVSARFRRSFVTGSNAPSMLPARKAIHAAGEAIETAPARSLSKLRHRRCEPRRGAAEGYNAIEERTADDCCRYALFEHNRTSDRASGHRIECTAGAGPHAAVTQGLHQGGKRLGGLTRRQRPIRILFPRSRHQVGRPYRLAQPPRPASDHAQRRKCRFLRERL